MSDGFSLDDALGGPDAQQSHGQSLNNPWGAQNPGQPGQPGQQYPGFPGPGQQYPGFPAQGQQYPGFPGAPQGQGQQYPGFPGAPQGPGQQYPGFPGAPQGPGFPGAPQGQQYPGFPPGGQQYPGFPAAGQQYPGYPGPGEPSAAGARAGPIVPPGPKKVPCELPLPSGCTAGMMLNIQGVPTGKRFSIDFVEGPDIAFHLNPRFDERPNVIVRNSMIRGNWGQEERQCPKFPFQMQQAFKLQIIFEPDCYKVAVNNENLCKYPHRLKNPAGIKCIRINGHVIINDASVTMV
ncbi:galectin-3 [Anomaloglossus baeobatrachus]|uniref:galectin-3 n=1 Tax=Anomaloglossus baeobatrachus TaxID=238106 RepID=UPI003F50317B